MGSSVVVSVNSQRNTCNLVAPESAPHDQQMVACGFEKLQRLLTPVMSLTTEYGSSNGEKYHLGKIQRYYVHRKDQ